LSVPTAASTRLSAPTATSTAAQYTARDRRLGLQRRHLGHGDTTSGGLGGGVCHERCSKSSSTPGGTGGTE
jgi:hypothetical protein